MNPMKPDWRQIILYITVMGTEGCWLYALMAMLNEQVANGRLSVLGLLLLYLASFGFNLMLRWLRWPRVFLGSVSWLAWLVGMLVVVKVQLFGGSALLDSAWLMAVPRAIPEVIYTFRPELLILVGTAVFWWLGWRLAHLRANFTALVSEFQFGLVILVITFLVAIQLGIELAGSVYLVLLFSLFALLGTSIAHAMEGTSWLSGLFQGHWSGLLLVSISLILILGLLISALVTPELLQLILAALKWVLAMVMKGVFFIAGKIIPFLSSLFPTPEPVEMPSLMPTPDITGPLVEVRRRLIPEWVTSGLRIAWTVMVLGFVAFALWRVSSQIFGWLQRKLAGMSGAEFETLPGAFRADFVGFLKSILSRLLRLRLRFKLGVKAKPAFPELNSVRQIYRQLLRWASSGGYPRHGSQTPYEYLYTLSGLLPEAQADLDLITQQYVRTRYGASLPAEDKLQELRQSWHKVRRSRLKQTEVEHNQEGGKLNG